MKLAGSLPRKSRPARSRGSPRLPQQLSRARSSAAPHVTVSRRVLLLDRIWPHAHAVVHQHAVQSVPGEARLVVLGTTNIAVRGRPAVLQDASECSIQSWVALEQWLATRVCCCSLQVLEHALLGCIGAVRAGRQLLHANQLRISSEERVCVAFGHAQLGCVRLICWQRHHNLLAFVGVGAGLRDQGVVSFWLSCSSCRS